MTDVSNYLLVLVLFDSFFSLVFALTLFLFVQSQIFSSNRPDPDSIYLIAQLVQINVIIYFSYLKSKPNYKFTNSKSKTQN